MKVLRLEKNIFSTQKCLLPDCEYLKENHGKYCFVTKDECKVLIKIGLGEIKNIKDTVFLDDSVTVPSSFNKILSKQFPSDVIYDDFTVLSKPTIAKKASVNIVFNDALDIKNSKNSEKLEKIVKDILKLYVVSNECCVSLNNLHKSQKFGINYIIINEISGCEQNKVFQVDATTKICVKKCFSQLQLEQYQEKDNQIQIGGCSRIYEILKETINWAKSFDALKIKLIKKIILIGPRGCGKTTLIRNLASDCKCILLEIAASEINCLTSADVERKLQRIFKEAKIYSENYESCVILFDDIDLMCAGKSSQSVQFISILINLLKDVDETSGIVVIATTNSPEDVDLQLRQPKKFENELEIMVPTEDERKEILQNILNFCKIDCSDPVLSQIAKWTPGFVGADLRLAVLEGLVIYSKQMSLSDSINNNILLKCFKQALTKVTPSALRGTIGLCTAKDTTFSQIGGLESVKKVLNLSVKQQLENPEKFLKFGIPLTKGILLYGPPGCAKTTLVKALAKECNATFIATSAADLYSPFVGDAEKKIVQLFTQARIGCPSILFIDEIDAVVGSKTGERERGVQERILSTLLIEMDGVGLKVNTSTKNSLNILGKGEKVTEKPVNSGVIVVGATNRPQLLDDALKRPGRFDRLLYVPYPDEEERCRILKKLTENIPLDESVDLRWIASKTNFYSGADLRNLCQESGLFALKSSDMKTDSVHQCHFDHVLKEYKPSLNKKMIEFYESFHKYNI